MRLSVLSHTSYSVTKDNLVSILTERDCGYESFRRLVCAGLRLSIQATTACIKALINSDACARPGSSIEITGALSISFRTSTSSCCSSVPHRATLLSGSEDAPRSGCTRRDRLGFRSPRRIAETPGPPRFDAIPPG
jgi:hypothetical protein